MEIGGPTSPKTVSTKLGGVNPSRQEQGLQPGSETGIRDKVFVTVGESWSVTINSDSGEKVADVPVQVQCRVSVGRNWHHKISISKLISL